MKKFFAVFIFLFSFLALQQETSAMEIMRKEGTIFGPTTIESNRVQTMLPGGKTKFLRNVKYLDHTQKEQVYYSQTSGNFTRFSYRCPGYYMTRTYSDYQGKKQTGTIRVYVAPGDIPNQHAGCGDDVVTPPPNNDPPTAPPDVVEINSTHPNALAIEGGNMIKENYDFPDGVDAKFEGQIADPDSHDYVDKFTEYVAPAPPDPLPFQNPYYDPLNNFAAFYPPPPPEWHIGDWDLSNPDEIYPLISVGNINLGDYFEPDAVNRDLEEEACVAAGGDIHYYEQYYDDYKNLDEDNTLCIGHEEYNNCQLVRYMATYRDGWEEIEDEDFENIATDLKAELNFPSIYCKHLKNYIEPPYPYDPLTTENVLREQYVVIECLDDSDSCHDMLPDPYYTPISTPIEPGGDNGGSNGNHGGSPRRY